jgi:hypothetical protein
MSRIPWVLGPLLIGAVTKNWFLGWPCSTRKGCFLGSGCDFLTLPLPGTLALDASGCDFLLNGGRIESRSLDLTS